MKTVLRARVSDYRGVFWLHIPNVSIETLLDYCAYRGYSNPTSVSRFQCYMEEYINIQSDFKYYYIDSKFRYIKTRSDFLKEHHEENQTSNNP